MRPYPGKTTAEVHDYHDTATGVIASSLSKRAAGYTSLRISRPTPDLNQEIGGRGPAISPKRLDVQRHLARLPSQVY
jgi:hypothetical protein